MPKVRVKSTYKDIHHAGQGERGDATLPKSAPRAMDSITMATSGRSATESQKARDSPAPKELGRSRGCRWTLYQYEPLLEELRTFAKDKCRYAVWGYEICPDTGRPHLQGYWYIQNKYDRGKFSSQFNNCWVGSADLTPTENRNYCLKLRPGDTPNEKYEEYGTLPTQGQRADWSQALSDLKTKPVIEVLESQPHLVPCQRALREVKNMFLKPLHRDVNVIVLFGQAGAGKTRWAYDNYSDIYDKPVGEWWDKYDGQKTVLLDDFYGWIKYHDLLRVLDRYPYNAQYKGGYVYAQWDTVIITSNEHPRKWYKDKGLTPALRRRLKKILYVSVIDGETSYEEVNPASEETPGSQEETDANYAIT